MLAAVGAHPPSSSCPRPRPSLFSYQETGVTWLAERRNALLADEMRLGKTCQVLEAARRVNPNAPILVVGPAVARAVWKAEAAVWRPELKVRMVEHIGTFSWPAPGELVAVSYHLTPSAVGRVPQGTILVFDECQAANHASSKTTQRCAMMADAVRRNGGRVWCLTGTPVIDRPRDLWSILGLMGHQLRCFASYQEFLSLNGYYVINGRPQWGRVSPEVGLRLQRVMLRRTRREVLGELPPVVQTIPVPLEPELRKEADRVLEAMYRAIRQRGLSLWEAYQFATSPKSGLGFAGLMANVSLAKLPYLQQIVREYEQAGEPLVVASEYVGPVKAIGARDGWASITGGTTPKARTKIQEDFRAGRLHGVAITIGAAGVAIDLSTAAHMVIVTQAVSPGKNEQVIARIQGPRQKRPTCLLYLVADHQIEQRLWELLAEKQNAIEDIQASMVRHNSGHDGRAQRCA